MDPALQERLNAIEEKLERIEKTIVRVRKVQQRTNTMRSLYWLFIILIGLGAFYFLKPMIEQLKTVYGSIGGDSEQLELLFEQFKNDM